MRGIRTFQIAIVSIILLANVAIAEVLRLAELNTRQIAALDRSTTVVIIPGGILEEHGPYLPSFSDGYLNIDESDQLAKDLSARDWTVLMFPVIPLGALGANEIGERFVFAGTYAIRPEVLRAIFMDIAIEFGEQGFRYIFVVHAHGGPTHSMALDQAGQFFKDEFDGQMHHLYGYTFAEFSAPEQLSEEALEEDGFSVHGGVMEHSVLMHLQSDLVANDIAEAPAVTGQNFEGLMNIASKSEWTGYFGSPRWASAAVGRSIADRRHQANLQLALRVLDGDDLTGIPRWATIAYQDSDIRLVIDRSREENARRAKRQEEWIKKSGSEL